MCIGIYIISMKCDLPTYNRFLMFIFTSVSSCRHFGNYLRVPWHITIEFWYDQQFYSQVYPQEKWPKNSHKNLYVNVHNRQKVNNPSADGWIFKMWYFCTMGYYSAIKRNQVLLSAITWLDFEDIMLSERSQAQKTAYHASPFTWNAQNQQPHRS